MSNVQTATLYKILNPDGTPCHGGRGKWHLPHDGQPGEWMPEIKGIKLCERGYHAVEVPYLLDWSLPSIWTFEGRGEHQTDGEKHVFGQARLPSRVETWTEQTARLFMADCAERVLFIFERVFPQDRRPHDCLLTSRRFAFGLCDSDTLRAAWAAAWAAWEAAWVAGEAARAAGAAAWAAKEAAWAVWEAARVARVAREAAWAAGVAWAAAWAAWEAVERQWQNTRLKEYIDGLVDLNAIREAVEKQGATP